MVYGHAPNLSVGPTMDYAIVPGSRNLSRLTVAPGSLSDVYFYEGQSNGQLPAVRPMHQFIRKYTGSGNILIGNTATGSRLERIDTETTSVLIPPRSFFVFAAATVLDSLTVTDPTVNNIATKLIAGQTELPLIDGTIASLPLGILAVIS